MYLYIYIHMLCPLWLMISIHISIYSSLSLSMYMYICIYIYIYTYNDECRDAMAEKNRPAGLHWFRASWSVSILLERCVLWVLTTGWHWRMPQVYSRTRWTISGLVVMVLEGTLIGSAPPSCKSNISWLNDLGQLGLCGLHQILFRRIGLSFFLCP